MKAVPLKIHPRAIARQIGDKTLVEHLDFPLRRLVLSPTGTAIWSQLEQGGNEKGIAAELARSCGIDEAAVTQDVSRFVNELVARDVLVSDEKDFRPIIGAPPESSQSESALYASVIEEARRRRIPHKASLEVTYRCNLRCVQCYVAPKLTDVASHRNALGTSRLQSVVAELRELGCFQITFTGGELFVRPDILDLLRHTDDVGCAIRIQTNGQLIRSDHVEALKALKRLESLEISLFGATEETYDRVTRRRGGFRRLQKSLALLREAGVPAILKYVLLRQNAHEVGLVQRLAESFGIRPLVCFMHVYPSTLGSLSNEDQRLNADTVRDLFEKRLLVPTQVATADKFWLCQAGIVRLNITPEGEMWPCERLPFSFGNIRETAVRDVWYSERAEHYRSLIAEAHPRCTDCQLKPFCCHCWAMPYLHERLPVETALASCRGYTSYNCELARRRAEGFSIQRLTIEQKVRSQVF
jgi:radical SAM protein with 4Fe4S-binding SPASM domain